MTSRLTVLTRCGADFVPPPTLELEQFRGWLTRFEAPVVIAFLAATCPKCGGVATALDELIPSLDGQVTVLRVDAGGWPEVLKDFGVLSVPTLMLFVGGAAVYQFAGSPSCCELRFVMDRLTNPNRHHVPVRTEAPLPRRPLPSRVNVVEALTAVSVAGILLGLVAPTPQPLDPVPAVGAFDQGNLIQPAGATAVSGKAVPAGGRAPTEQSALGPKLPEWHSLPCTQDERARCRTRLL